jgi:DNA helicase HerA-like ATPase
VIDLSFSIFFGSSGTGKTHIASSIARALARNSHKVLVVDATQHQGMYHNFTFNKDIEKAINPDKPEPFIREQFDIIAFDYKKYDEFNQKNFLKNIKYEGYEHVFIEVEEPVEMGFIKGDAKFFLIQNLDAVALIRNKDILDRNNSLREAKLHIVFNQFYWSKLKMDYINKQLGTKDIANIILPYSFDDVKVSCNNKVDGKINISKYSQDQKMALFEILTYIVGDLKQDTKTFKNYVG